MKQSFVMLLFLIMSSLAMQGGHILSIADTLDEQLYCSLLYVNKPVRESIVALICLFPEHSWSSICKNIVVDINNEATVMPYKDVMSVLNECLEVCNILSFDKIDMIKTELEQYKTIVEAGKAHISSWKNDEDANEIITRNFDGSREILQLYTRNLTVDGTETLTGLLTVNGVLKVNGRILLNNTDISTIIAASTANGNVTGTTNHAVQVGNASGGLSSITPIGTAGEALVSNGPGADPSFQTVIQGISTDGGGIAFGQTVVFKSSSIGDFPQGTAHFYGNNSNEIRLAWDDANSNTGIGSSSLNSLSGGLNNVGFGVQTGFSTTSGNSNTFIGYNAGNPTTTGVGNICIGANAGLSLAGGNSFNILIGTGELGVSGDNNTTRIGTDKSKCFIGGIRGIATDVADAIPVLIDSASQLGTTSSSKRFKENIIPMPASFSDNLLQLNPILFNYKQDESKKQTWGLIAEEVQQIFPELVISDKEGLPLTVKYHDMPVLLLNELIKMNNKIITLENELNMLKK